MKTKQENKEDWNLSDKIISCESDDPNVIGISLGKDSTLFVEDVKEFIKRLKEKCELHRLTQDIIIYIDKLAGDKLK